MASASYNVSASIDDVRCTSTGASYTATSVTQYLGDFSGTDYYAGLRWNNINIPQGAVISSASLNLYSAGVANGATTRIVWVGEASDNAAEFSSSSKPVDRISTVAREEKEYDSSNWSSVGFGINPSDVTSIVQEIVDRPGWVSGNSLVIIGHDNASDSNAHVGFSTYDRASDRGAILAVDYNEGSTSTTLVLDEATQDQTVTEMTLQISVQTTVTADNALQMQTALTPSLTMHEWLAMNDAEQTTSSSDPSLRTADALVVRSSTQVQGSTTVILATHESLAIADATHVHAASKVAVSIGTWLSIADMSHEQNSQSIMLVQSSRLSIAEVSTTQESGSVTLSEHVELDISDVAHALYSRNISLFRDMTFGKVTVLSSCGGSTVLTNSTRITIMKNRER